MLVLSDEYRGDWNGEYFAGLSEQVCRQLVDCGYRLCPGDIMVSNPRWRMSLGDWRDHFRRWIDEPEPGALLRLCIFSDLRAIFGDAGLVETLRRDFLARTRTSPWGVTTMQRLAVTLIVLIMATAAIANTTITSAFGYGISETTISAVDAQGIAFAAIQGLNEKLEAENAELRARLDRLEALFLELIEKTGGMP